MPLPTCVVLDGWTLTEHVPKASVPDGEPTWHALEQLVTLTVYPRTPADALLERASRATLLLTNKVVLDAAAIAALPELRYIGVLATGTNVVDLAAAKQRGIVVTNVPGYATESVVAHVFGLIFELRLRVAEHATAVRKGAWCSATDFTFRLATTTELAGQTLGIVGFGHIGQRVAAVGQAFGMRILAALRPGATTPNRPVGSDVEFCSTDELFATSDIISLHCPLTPETANLVDARRLALMKSDAILINTGRGPLIDEPTLAQALNEHRIGGAGLDVLSREPPQADNPLLSAPRCIITPHIAWATTAARQRLMQVVTANVAAYLAGKPTHRVA